MSAPAVNGENFTRSTADGTSVTFANFSVSNVADRVLVLRVGVIRTSENNFTLTATYGGVAMTEAVTVSEAASGSSRRYRQSIFYLIAPAIGTADFVVTASSTVRGWILDATLLIGAHQTAPIGVTATGIGSSTDTNTLTLNGCVADSLILAAVISNTNNTPTWTWATATETYDLNGSASSSEPAGSGAQYQTTAAGNVTITSTRSASVATMVAAAVEFKCLPVPETITATATDTWRAAESAGRRAAYRATVIDAYRGGDVPGRRASLRPAAVDALKGSEAVARRAIYRRMAADGLRGAESVARRAVYRRVAADGLRGGETTGRRASYRATATDTTGLAGGLTPRRALRATAVESLGLAGAMGRRADWRVTLPELLKLLETAMGGGRVAASALDALALAGTAPVGYRIARTAADTWRLSPAAARSATLRPTALDTLTLAGAAALPLPAETGSIHQVAASDGIETVSSGAVALTTTSFNVNSSQMFAARFDNLDIPPGAVIDASDLEVWVLSPYDDPGLTTRAQASPSPAALSTTDYDISGRSLTAEGAVWTAANVGAGQYVHSADLAAVIQEVVDLAGWTRGTSDILLVLRDNGTGGWLRGQTSDNSSGKPYLNITWHAGGLVVTATAADALAVLEDATRRAILAAALADSASLAAATATALTLLVADDWRLAEAVATLARLTIGDEALLGDGVYLTYALSLTEPLALHVAVARIAQLRAARVDALAYTEVMQTRANTHAGDAVAFVDALAARRLLIALAADPLLLRLAATGDMAGLLEALADDRLRLADAARAGWLTGVQVADGVSLADALTVLRRLVAAPGDALAARELAARIVHARATAADAADFAERLGTLARATATDALGLDDATIAAVAAILYALAADVVALADGATLLWRVTARDTLEFAATVATAMHWLEEVADAVEVRGLAVFLLPNGIVRIEFSIMGLDMAIEIAMPRVDVAAISPSVDIAGHGFNEV